MSSPYFIGITGGSASGKTLFLRSLKEKFSSEKVSIISMDNYYKAKDLQPKDELGIENFDTPTSIAVEELISDLKLLKEGKTIRRKEYTFNNPKITAGTIVNHPAPVIVVEGIFVLYFPELISFLDLKVFLDVKDFLRLKRRITRDKIERGYDLEDVLYRYENHAAPTYEKYIAPYKGEADIVIPNNKHFAKGLELLETFINTKINDK